MVLVPLGELLASGLDHPATQFAGQVGGLDDVDERIGLQYPEGGVRPSDQCFHAEYGAGDQVHLRLVMQGQ